MNTKKGDLTIKSMQGFLKRYLQTLGGVLILILSVHYLLLLKHYSFLYVSLTKIKLEVLL